ncbi:MAG TPA: hypothetical protein PLN56_01870 [Methanoregulaceae archaeon]|nr:MAG: hypothetical protein IPI71_02555 [Methanolinea sp.]HON82352.1 hypothetical protein [Methanoregulaceae archaeon]HPD09736.1 hypothetical protein [Methanoregulaceae archaeon]HRT14543.1 hypothetical protein [Methanoregulaceae archaeon]HRU30114.1 hypothetical protein [Methanoregulaceae archaeon]
MNPAAYTVQTPGFPAFSPRVGGFPLADILDRFLCPCRRLPAGRFLVAGVIDETAYRLIARSPGG